jgi:Bacterial SH3 domain
MAFGALLYAGNTLLYTNVIFGWPKSKLEADAGKETVKPKAEAPRPDRQPAEIAESQSPAQQVVEPQPAPAQPQGKHAPDLDIAAGAPPPDSATTAKLPPMPQDQRAPESSAQQQVQSTPPAQPGSDSSPAQAAANTAPPTPQGGNELPSQTTLASAAQQAHPTPQPEQAMPATEEPATEPQQQSGGEWVRSGDATVRSGPSSSASQLWTLRSGMEVMVVGRRSGWVQIANSDGSQTGWVYEKLVESVAAPNEQSAAGTEAAQPENQSQQAKGQTGWVKVLGSPAGMRSSPSQSSPILFAFPEGRELRVVSRQPGCVQVTDPGSKQSGWVAETSLVVSVGNAAQHQAAGASPRQQASSAPSRRHRLISPGHSTPATKQIIGVRSRRHLRNGLQCGRRSRTASFAIPIATSCSICTTNGSASTMC